MSTDQVHFFITCLFEYLKLRILIIGSHKKQLFFVICGIISTYYYYGETLNRQHVSCCMLSKVQNLSYRNWA